MLEFNDIQDAIDSFVDFIYELIDLLKEDWKKFKHFISENGKYVFWLFIAIITLQFTDIMSIGASWEKYNTHNTHNNNHTTQKGGSGGEGGESTSGAPPDAPPDAPAKPTKEEKQAQKKADKEKKQATDKAKSDQKRQMIDQTKKGLLQKDAEKKQKVESGSAHVDKQLGLFNKLKGDVKSSAGKHGLGGPILGKLGGVFDTVSGMFVVLGFILLIIGVISLPVIVFLVITYCVVKKLVGTFMGL